MWSPPLGTRDGCMLRNNRVAWLVVALQLQGTALPSLHVAAVC